MTITEDAVRYGQGLTRTTVNPETGEVEVQEIPREATWEDDDGNLFPWPMDVTPEINLFQAAIICILITGIITYAVLAWAL